MSRPPFTPQLAELLSRTLELANRLDGADRDTALEIVGAVTAVWSHMVAAIDDRARARAEHFQAVAALDLASERFNGNPITRH